VDEYRRRLSSSQSGSRSNSTLPSSEIRFQQRKLEGEIYQKQLRAWQRTSRKPEATGNFEALPENTAIEALEPKPFFSKKKETGGSSPDANLRSQIDTLDRPREAPKLEQRGFFGTLASWFVAFWTWLKSFFA
jgi:hypothetical protein